MFKFEERKVKEASTLAFRNLHTQPYVCSDGRRYENEVCFLRREAFSVGGGMLTLGVHLSVFQHTLHVFTNSTLSFALIIKRIVISFLITSLLSFPSLASFALCLN